MANAATATRDDGRAAASDAAAEARAEIVQRSAASTQAGAKVTSEKGKARAASASGRYHEFAVSVWMTNFNSVEFGFFKRSRNKAKSRQFTSDMDIYAEILENGARTGLIGYRAELWTQNKGFDRRLVFKLFGDNLNWHATMDMMLARSVQQTVGARGLPVVSYSINGNDHEDLVIVERSAHKWPLMPEHYSFFLLDEGRMRFFRLQQEMLTLTTSYTLYDGAGRRIGAIDGRLLTLTGHWDCRVLADHADKRLLSVLKLFTGMLLYKKGARRHVGELARSLGGSKELPKIERQEADLYLNPRRVR